MTRVLVIDDEVAVAELVRVVLEEANFRVSVATDTASIPSERFDCVVADLVGLKLYSFNAASDFLLRLRDRLPGSPVIVLTAHAEASADAQRLGVRVITKPFDLDDLVAAVRDATAR